MSNATDEIPIHVHRLEGCRPTPLAHYLKGLGVLRLVTEQADPNARAWWKDNVLHLATKLDREELQEFFLTDYRPSPILSPWLKGSGFYQANDAGLSPLESSQAQRLEAYRDGIQQCRALLTKIEAADAVIRAVKARTKTDSSFQTQQQRETTAASELFAGCLRALEGELEELSKPSEESERSPADQAKAKQLEQELATIRGLVSEPGTDPQTGSDRRPTRAEATALKKQDGYKRILKYAEAEFASQKASLISNCKKQWRGPLADWFAVAVVIEEDKSARWPALLGTGGNDGNLDFTNNFMQRLRDLFDFNDGAPTPLAKALLEPSLFNTNSRELQQAPSGQFYPTSTGGPNCGSGFQGSVALNIWDYVLMFEGTFLFRSGVSRRLAAHSLPQASAPFAFRASGIGYGSADDADEGARGEQWMPIWSRPSRLADVQALFQQARAQVGRSPAERGLGMVRAVARLGTTRGIQQFERFGYIERNGLSNLAVPLGRFHVEAKEHQHLLDAVSPWMDQLRRIANGKNAPASLQRVHRNCEQAMLQCTQRPDASAFLDLLVAIAEAEDRFMKSPRYAAEANARPMPTLDNDWLQLFWNDVSLAQNTEFRLAVALAAQFASHRPKRESASRSTLSIRHYWLPLEPFAKRFVQNEAGFARGPRQCAMGLPLEKALQKVIQRRLHETDRGQFQPPLQLCRQDLGARLEDISAFLAGDVDDARVLVVARALMAVNFRSASHDAFRSPDTASVSQRGAALQREGSPLGGLATYGVIRLAYAGVVATGGSRNAPTKKAEIRTDPVIFNRLLAGDLQGALARAIRQTSIAGLRPHIQVAVGSQSYSRRIAAALGFGISGRTMGRLAASLTSPEVPTGEDLESVVTPLT